MEVVNKQKKWPLRRHLEKELRDPIKEANLFSLQPLRRDRPDRLVPIEASGNFPEWPGNFPGMSGAFTECSAKTPGRGSSSSRTLESQI